MTTKELLLACLADVILGDPSWMPHPVRWMGGAIARYEGFVRPLCSLAYHERIAGIVLAVGLPATAWLLAWGTIEVAGRIHPQIQMAVTIWLAFTTLAGRDLVDHVREVLRYLETRSLGAARQSLARIVGRDTGDLSEREVVRGTIETMAESTSDGIVAPLFYLALGGPALALAYKAINTLDSVVGHRDEAYKHLGWASARFDDVANWIPARLTGLLSVAASTISFSTMPVGYAWRIMVRDCRRHPSPNSGWPEAAIAGVLGVQLGGRNVYGGRLVARPLLGDPRVPLASRHIRTAFHVLAVTVAFAVGLAILGTL